WRRNSRAFAFNCIFFFLKEKLCYPLQEIEAFFALAEFFIRQLGNFAVQLAEVFHQFWQIPYQARKIFGIHHFLNGVHIFLDIRYRFFRLTQTGFNGRYTLINRIQRFSERL
ncbi:hypothetical protein, partial [Salmonella enterica]|uniref:hypothetical protein n=1 Tax=Salmonella enterica TaxID=28901 RepID=UPI0019D6260B